MKVIECKDYNREFPELWTWGHVDSPKISSIASMLVAHIEHDIKKERNFVPGLRMALNIVAELADC